MKTTSEYLQLLKQFKDYLGEMKVLASTMLVDIFM